MIYLLGRGLAATWRVEVEDRSGLFGPGRQGPLLFSVWHNRLGISMAFYKWVARNREAAGLAALISASKDGAVLARALEHFGVRAARGSSSRRGARALLELTAWTSAGYHVAITPDGPRGPKYMAKEGIIGLAQLTGLPIVPMGARIESKKTLKSWDQFQIPLPFAQCRLIVGEPLFIPKDADDGAREALRLELERRMKEVSPD